MFGRKKPEVLVIGAGPVGLFAALILARRGIQVSVIDRDWRTGAHSYALGLHNASLDLLAEVGLRVPILEKSLLIDTVGFYERRQKRASIGLGDCGGIDARVAAMRQDVLEHVLEDALRKHGVEVLWNHEVSHIESRDDHVAVTVHKLVRDTVGYAVAHSEWTIAKTTEMQVPFVIGADGHRSAVRRALEIDYPEVGEAQHFAVFEFKADVDLGQELRIGMKSGAMNVLWPLPAGFCRWSLELTDELPTADSRTKHRVGFQLGTAQFPILEAEKVKKLMAEHAPCDTGEVDGISWQIAVRFERRLADSFGRQRLWLAGDSGHITGPVGMQSMNVGIREAHDLAGAIFGVLREQASPESLEEYGQQRLAEWRHLFGIDGGLRTTEGTDPWIAERSAAILPCLPASGPALTRLSAAIGLEG
jgi:2-polyprenyl-6-methoxyphenol hydroxylase-like FAD-dependent oxidoreductase